MGKASRDKGARNERHIVHELRERGIICDRVPLSGAAGGRFAGDIIVEGRLRFEAKLRADGFRELYKWLEENDGLFLRADRRQTLVVVRLSDFVSVLPALSELHGKKSA